MKNWRDLRSITKIEAPVVFALKCLLTLLILYWGLSVAGPAFAQGGGTALSALMQSLVLGLGINILWRNAIIDFITSPLTNIFTGNNQAPDARPHYSIAIARRKRGQYAEAMEEIREQLSKFPNDYEGLFLLAAIQAENMKDLPAADITLNQYCDEPAAHLNFVTAALTQLADWHIKAGDTDSARSAFRKIVERFPNTTLSRQAEQRIAHLDGTQKNILAQHSRQTIPLGIGIKNLGLLDSPDFLQSPEIDPVRLASSYVEHLEDHPHDTEVRENLALVYANDFKRLDLAKMELEQLINGLHHKPKQVAHWLNLLANLQIELGADLAGVQTTLQKIVERFPNQPVAEMAQRRIALLNNEFRGRQETTLIKLGVYEQNIGLKYGRPSRS